MKLLINLEIAYNFPFMEINVTIAKSKNSKKLRLPPKNNNVEGTPNFPVGLKIIAFF